MKQISVIVTNWNGLSLLKKNLPEIIKCSPQASEIIVADDASQDDSLSYVSHLQKQHPHLKIISQKENIGFCQNSNNAVIQAKGKYVVLLNNDILPRPDFISNSIKHFSDQSIFGVGFSEIDHPNWAKIFWHNGYLQHDRGLIIDRPHITGWVSGGSSIIDKTKFLKLGGFDPIYSPFYSEDLDLGYRAWKSGYTLIWEPSSQVYHKHETTISKFPRYLTDYVKERNRLLSVWRNITDKKMLSQNRLAQVLRVISGPNYIKIILAAHRQLTKFPPPIVFPKLTDRQIFDKFTD